MLTTLRNAWKIPDLRKKIIYTLLMMVIFRLGANVPVPGIDKAQLASMFAGDDTILGFMNLMSGGAFKNVTLFALGIGPYITSSIILNLLGMAIPYFENLSKEGEAGRRKMAQFTRYGTIILALVQAVGYSTTLYRNAFVVYNFQSVFLAVMTLTAGTAFLMYLGEKITENGIGNGISMFKDYRYLARPSRGHRSHYPQWQRYKGFHRHHRWRC